jgi:hypothetical protein
VYHRPCRRYYVVELDGEHHFKPVKFFGLEDVAKQVTTDVYKVLRSACTGRLVGALRICNSKAVAQHLRELVNGDSTVALAPQAWVRSLRAYLEKAVREMATPPVVSASSSASPTSAAATRSASAAASAACDDGDDDADASEAEALPQPKLTMTALASLHVKSIAGLSRYLADTCSSNVAICGVPVNGKAEPLLYPRLTAAQFDRVGTLIATRLNYLSVTGAGAGAEQAPIYWPHRDECRASYASSPLSWDCPSGCPDPDHAQRLPVRQWRWPRS